VASAEAFRIDSRKVVHETIDGEVILIHLETGNYYSLDGGGAEIWELVQRHGSAGGVVEELGRRHGDTDRRLAVTVRGLLHELAVEGLLEVEDPPVEDRNGETVPDESPYGAGTFPRPVLTRYTDMQDFLLVDPIHEVADSGWPDRK